MNTAKLNYIHCTNVTHVTPDQTDIITRKTAVCLKILTGYMARSLIYLAASIILASVIVVAAKVMLSLPSEIITASKYVLVPIVYPLAFKHLHTKEQLKLADAAFGSLIEKIMNKLLPN